MCGRVQASKRTPPGPIAHSQVKKKIKITEYIYTKTYNVAQ